MPATSRQQLRLLYGIARGHGPLLRTHLMAVTPERGNDVNSN